MMMSPVKVKAENGLKPATETSTSAASSDDSDSDSSASSSASSRGSRGFDDESQSQSMSQSVSQSEGYSVKEEPVEAKAEPESEEEEEGSSHRKSQTSQSESEDDIPLSQKVKKEREEGSTSRESAARRPNYREDSEEERNGRDVKEEEEEDEDDIPLSQKKKKSSSKKSSKKRAKESEDEEETYTPDKKKHKKSSSKSSSSKKKRKASSDDEDEDYDDDDDSDFGSKKKKSAKKSKNKVKEEKKSKKSKGSVSSKTASSTSSSPSKSKVKKEESESPTKGRKKKEEDEEHIWKWWEDKDSMDPNVKWKTLVHKGPVFAPPYEPLPKSVKFYYNKEPMRLQPAAEEIATFYSKMIEHDYVTKDVFNNNFFKDWKKYMTKEEKEKITDLKKCDFRDMAVYFKEQSEKRKAMSKEEKLVIKQANEKIQEEYGFCIVDGHKQKIGNYRVEPPGLFRGRGEHPKMGKVKKRIEAEDVIINIGKKAPVPEPPEKVGGGRHKWKEVRHDISVTWLASWNENIMGSVKYIMLNPSSKLKSMKDYNKYEKARELDKIIHQIRKDYENDFKAREMVKRQRAVALYFIDRLALRAGNEKEEGETADTVGCCSLRVEHIELSEEGSGDSRKYMVNFDFLGKDSIRYLNSVSVEKRVYKNVKLFMEGKSPGDDLFDRLNTMSLNKYLNTLMEGLSAKVFRTYNASITLQRQLDHLMKDADKMSDPEKLLAYNRANRAVAVLCNHQRSAPKTFDTQMSKLAEKIEEKKDQIKQNKKALKATSGSVEQAKLKKKAKTLDEQLKKLEVQETDKKENKTIALGTSKLNYLDPRISIAWCKKFDVKIEKIFNKTQRDKFRWAIEMAGPDYRF